MHDLSPLLTTLSASHFTQAELAQRLVLDTRGWSLTELENLFELALGSGLLSRDEAQSLLPPIQAVADFEALQGWPELAEIQNSLALLDGQQQQLLHEHQQLTAQRAALRQWEEAHAHKQVESQKITAEMAQWESEMQRLSQLMQEVVA